MATMSGLSDSQRCVSCEDWEGESQQKKENRYYYRVGDGENWSPVFSFATIAPFDPSAPVPLRVAVVGDMGLVNSNNTIANLIKLVENQDIDVLLHVGDISYADLFEGQWDEYMRKMEPAVANVPYMTIPGNHG